MGSLVGDSQIWVPDDDDLGDLDTLFATFASSIENGIGKRLAQQEIAVGLKGQAAGGIFIPPSEALVPYTITSGNGNFAQGMTINGGIVTVSTPGMYILTASASINPVALTANNANRTVAVMLYQNTGQLTGAEVSAVQNYYQTATASCVVRCVAGDQLYAKWSSAPSASGGGISANNPALTSISVAMVQAVLT